MNTAIGAIAEDSGDRLIRLNRLRRADRQSATGGDVRAKSMRVSGAHISVDGNTERELICDLGYINRFPYINYNLTS